MFYSIQRGFGHIMHLLVCCYAAFIVFRVIFCYVIHHAELCFYCVQMFLACYVQISAFFIVFSVVLACNMIVSMMLCNFYSVLTVFSTFCICKRVAIWFLLCLEFL